MNIVKVMPNINKHIKKGTAVITPDEHAHMGLNVPAIVFEYGDVRSKMKSIPNLGHYMIGCIRELNKTYRRLYKQPTAAKKEISKADFVALNDYIKGLDIEDFAFAPVDRSLIFKDKVILYENAIVLVMQMKPDIIKTAPSKAAEKEIFRTYYKLNVAVNKIKGFLNDRGYNAQAGPALGGEVNYPVLAQKAGLGATGKHGLLITDKSFGPSLRLAAVYTDIENLPMNEANDHLWVKDFCDACNRCVRKCPAEAIYKDTIVFEDKTLQHIDYKKCAVPFSKSRGCTVCVKECVFINGNYETIKAKFLNKADNK